MLSILFVLTTTLFGWSIVLLYRQRTSQLLLQISLGWLIGSMMTGLITFIITYFVSLSLLVVIGIMIFQLLFSAMIVYSIFLIYGKVYMRRLTILVEKNHWLYFSLFVAAVYSFYSVSNFYLDYPNSIPEDGKTFLECEHTAVMSMINGVNKKRKNFWVLSNPMLYNGDLYVSPLPISFTACLYTLHENFVDISFVISFFNTLSTVISLYLLTSTFVNFPFIVTMLFLFHSSWAFYHWFRIRDSNIDLIHNIGKEYVVPMYQPFFKFLVCSKSASYALPMGLFVLSIVAAQEANVAFYLMYFLAGLVAALIPSFTVASSVFIICFCNVNSILFTIIYSVSLVWKYQYTNLALNPIWREYQYDGVFVSQFWSWVDILGPFIVTFLIFPFMKLKPNLLHRVLGSITVMIYLSFVRSGGDHFENALGIATVVLPTAIIAMVSFLNTISANLSNRTRGNLLGFLFGFAVILIACGHVSCTRQLLQKVPGLAPDAKQVATFIMQNTPPDERIFTVKLSMNPATFLLGRESYIGDYTGHYQRGEPAQLFAVQSQTFEWIKIIEALHFKYALFERNSPEIGSYSQVMELMLQTDNWVLMKFNPA